MVLSVVCTFVGKSVNSTCWKEVHGYISSCFNFTIRHHQQVSSFHLQLWHFTKYHAIGIWQTGTILKKLRDGQSCYEFFFDLHYILFHVSYLQQEVSMMFHEFSVETNYPTLSMVFKKTSKSFCKHVLSHSRKYKKSSQLNWLANQPDNRSWGLRYKSDC